MSQLEETALKLKQSIQAQKAKLVNGTLEDALAGSKFEPITSSVKARRLLETGCGKVHDLDWASDPNKLITVSKEGHVLLWNAFSGLKLGAVHVRCSWLMACAFEKTTDSLVAAGGLDNTCSIHRLDEDNKVVAYRELIGHDGYISSCKFLDPARIITSSGDSTCILWDIEKRAVLGNFCNHVGDVMAVDVNPTDKNIFLSGSCDSTVKVWDIRSEKSVMAFEHHDSDVNAVSFMGSGKQFGTGSDDATCLLFDMRSISPLNKFEYESIVCGIQSIAFSKSGRILFGGYDDHSCYGWDTTAFDTDTPTFRLRKHTDRVSCIGMNSTGEALCTGSWDSTALVCTHRPTWSVLSLHVPFLFQIWA